MGTKLLHGTKSEMGGSNNSCERARGAKKTKWRPLHFSRLFLEPPKLSANPLVHAKNPVSVKIVLLLINGLVDLVPKGISYPPPGII